MTTTFPISSSKMNPPFDTEKVNVTRRPTVTIFLWHAQERVRRYVCEEFPVTSNAKMKYNEDISPVLCEFRPRLAKRRFDEGIGIYGFADGKSTPGDYKWFSLSAKFADFTRFADPQLIVRKD